MTLPGDSGTGSGEGNAGGEGLEQLKTQFDSLKGELDNLKAAKGDLERKLEDADKELLSTEYLEFMEGKKSGATRQPEDKGKEINLEEATPPQIVSYLESKYKGDIQKSVGDITKRIDSIEDTMGKYGASIDLTICSLKHKDLGEAFDTPLQKRNEEQKELVNTMFRIAKENPTWSSEKCYRQSRLEIKASVEEKDNAEREKAERERRLLSEKPGASDTVLRGKELTKEQAGDAAWKAAFGNKQSVE